jgi:hypothetical protein
MTTFSDVMFLIANRYKTKTLPLGIERKRGFGS